MSEAFNEHAGVAFDLFQSFVHLATQLLELPINRLESGIEVLDKFLIHGAPASWRICRSAALVNETRHAGKGENGNDREEDGLDGLRRLAAFPQLDGAVEAATDEAAAVRGACCRAHRLPVPFQVPHPA